ncbi:MAG: phosphoglucosamine mutase [Acidobacteria bacterium]|nr:phosphoglucosamine mutase [Acidobacteriota bacterium]
MTLRYFGTDGVRGRAYESPLTLAEATRWGAAWGAAAKAQGIQRLVAGWDPRLSSEPIWAAFHHGLGAGLEVRVLGLAPTPAVAWTVMQSTASGIPTWGLMISASHNPPEDNGLKGFSGAGEKLSEAEERAIEGAFDQAPDPGVETIATATESLDPYVDHLGGLDLPADLKVVVDCAHGATGPSAKRLLRGPGLHWLAEAPDGARINVGVGSTHLEALKAEVAAQGADFGLAFDGDGDRCLMVDAQGRVLDGDQMLWLLVQDRIAAGDPPPGAVGTVMTNGGLEAALAGAGVPFVRTPVGDKYLLRELAARGWDLAAEASGHVIQKRICPSGDGLATALSVLRALVHREPPAWGSWAFEPWPQRLINVVARERRPVEAMPALQGAMAAIGARHGSSARQVIRWSGTEPKLRLMVEAPEKATVDQALMELEAAARQDLGL